MRRIFGVAAIAIVGLACKPKQMTMAEDFEREACACKHRDFACANAARSKLDDGMSTPSGHWYDRAIDHAEWERHEQAGRECAHRVWSCSADDPCDAGSFCAAINATTGVGACARWLAEGEMCGPTLDQCAAGMYCDQPEPQGPDQCWPLGCVGKCVKGTPPPDMYSIAAHAPSALPSAMVSASGSASASASPSASK
jgi:hypothetical protein